METDKEFYTLDEFARLMCVSERTVREWIYTRKIPYLRPSGRKIIIEKAKALAALEKFENKAVSI